MSHIIFIHGASSSGKSTLAKAIQTRIEYPFWHISIDILRDAGVLPTERFRSGEFSLRDAREAFFDGFHASLAAYANAGNHLIIEHILETDEWLQVLRKLLRHQDVFFVGLHCPLEVLVDREIARGDRPIGSAKRDFESIHIGKVYDLELDALAGADANAIKLLDGWRSSKRSSSFDR